MQYRTDLLGGGKDIELSTTAAMSIGDRLARIQGIFQKAVVEEFQDSPVLVSAAPASAGKRGTIKHKPNLR